MESHQAAFPPRLAYSLAEAELVSNLSRATLYRQVARGNLRMVKVGMRSLIPADALAKLCGVAPAMELPGNVFGARDLAQSEQ